MSQRIPVKADTLAHSSHIVFTYNLPILQEEVYCFLVKFFGFLPLFRFLTVHSFPGGHGLF